MLVAGKANRWAVPPNKAETRNISLAGCEVPKAVFIKDVTTAFTCDSNMNPSLPFSEQRRGFIKVRPRKASEIYHQLPKATFSEVDQGVKRSQALI